MVAARRVFEGRLPLSAFRRLRDALYDPPDAAGEPGPVRFTIEFDRDALQVPYVEVRIDAQLPLECQRTLAPFLHPVNVVQRLGLIVDESDEAGLPPDYESLLVPADGEMRPLELVEDELILAVPVVAVQPGSELLLDAIGEQQAPPREWESTDGDDPHPNPFAVLAGLKAAAPKDK